MNQRTRFQMVGFTIALMFFLPIGWSAFGAQKIEPLKIGQKAPDFYLAGVDGKKHALKEYAKAQVLVVIFTCNHCPTAQAYEDRMIQLVKDYKNKSVAVVAISPNDPKAVRLNEMGYSDVGDTLEDNKIRAKHKKFNFPFLYDGDTQAASKLYGPRATPHVFIFDKDRKLRYEGGIDDSERLKRVKVRHVRNTLDALLAGKPVPKERTPTFGCSIKWAAKRGAVDSYMAKIAKEPVTLSAAGTDQVAGLMKNDSDDKLRLINVWATWCGPCRVEFPELVKIGRMYSHRDFELVTLSIDDPDDKDKALAFLQQQKQSTGRNLIFDNKDKNLLVDALQGEWMGAIPFTILVKPGGEIAYQHHGIFDHLKVKRAIVDVLGRTYK